MRFKILYCIFFVVCLFYSPKMLFGPISIRHVAVLIMLITCYVEGGVKFDNFLKWYSVFLFFCLISAISTGFGAFFATKLLGTYLGSVVLYMSTKLMISKYHSKEWVLYLVVGVACLNSIVAIGQFYKIPFAMAIPDLLGIRLEEDMVEFYERFDDFRGRYVGGLLGVVNSGYFLSAACVLSLCSKKNKIPPLNWALFLINLYALFLVQQRSGFFVGLFCVVLLISLIVIKRSRFSLVLIILFVVVAVVFWNFGSQLLSYNEMRYATKGLDNQLRWQLSMNGWRFFLSHPLGGIYAFRAAGNIDPHVLFVNAFLYGGVFGGLLILIYVVLQLKLIANIIVKTYRKKTYSTILIGFGLSYLSYTLCSFFHNLSLVYGEAMFFLFWGAVVSLYEIENNKKII